MYRKLNLFSMFLYGASGHASVIIEILEESNQEIQGLFDDNELIKELLGYKCYGKYTKVVLGDKSLIISIGNNLIRKQIVDRIGNINYFKAIHPNASISRRVKIGEGTVIMSGAIINSSVTIGNHSIINTASSIDHDCAISDYVHISPHATLCGNVSIGKGSHVGAAAVIIPGIKIGKWCTIGAGSIIIKDVEDYSTVVGNPGKIIKKKNE